MAIFHCKHGMIEQYCAICSGYVRRPLVARTNTASKPQNNSDQDDRFVTVTVKDMDRLSEVAPAETKYVHLRGSFISVPVIVKLLSYFSGLKIINCSPKTKERCVSRIDTFNVLLLPRGVTLQFEYVRAKGNRKDVKELRLNKAWVARRNRVLRFTPQERARLDKLCALGIAEAILFKKYFLLHDPKAERIGLLEVGKSLGSKDSNGGCYAVNAVMAYCLQETPKNANVQRVLSHLMNLASLAHDKPVEEINIITR